jgi:signal transduction histidine kinase
LRHTKVGIPCPCVPERRIEELVRFARVVSDANAPRDVLGRLADTLFEHVCPEGVGVFALESDAKLHLIAERNLGLKAKRLVIEIDEMSLLPETIRAQKSRAPTSSDSYITRPLVAGGDLYGAVILTCGQTTKLDANALALADGLIDLAAIGTSTATHVEKLEKQFEELQRQQEMLARTEKLRALGQMAAGVSHDLRNILNPLSLHIQVITRAIDRGETESAKESALEMKQVLQRGLATLERLRDFSRQSKEAKTELVDLDHLAREAAAIGKSRAGSGQRGGSGRTPKIIEELSSPTPVNAMSAEVVSALVNLVVNAVDAMNDPTAATTTTTPPGQGQITLRSGEDGENSWIEVGDDGPGMPADVAKRIFEPFFTTKGTEGTGLGLAMVYATMQRHGGTVTVKTQPGQGTTFRLSFPKPGPNSRAIQAAGQIE